MTDSYTDLSPYQQIGYAWNTLMNVRCELPKELFERITAVLTELDSVLLALPTDPTGFPLPNSVPPGRALPGDDRG